jgi:hypothetical protein
LCLFIFCQHKQLPMVAQFFKGYASPEVMWPREVATDPTFLTGFFVLFSFFFFLSSFFFFFFPFFLLFFPLVAKTLGIVKGISW